MKRVCLNVVLGLAMTTLAGHSANGAEYGRDTYRQNASIGKGINLGNALEAPKEGEWRVRLEDAYFDLIAKADSGEAAP